MDDTDSPTPDLAPARVETGLPNINPDLVEQELGAEIDNIIPTVGYQLLPMVGIGGSAGSIRAIQAFFEKMPAESGMVFVVIMHLSPDHVSSMPEMDEDARGPRGTKVEANRVYVIPPVKHLTATNGHLKLTDLDRERGDAHGDSFRRPAPAGAKARRFASVFP